MRKLLLAVFLLLTVLLIKAQSTFTNTTSEAVDRVIRDYRFHFKNIRGEQLSQTSAGTGYRSTVTVPGTINCFITTYSGADADACSWQAVIIETTNFAAARIKYKQVFDQVKNTIVKVDGQRPSIINGRFDVPVETKKLNNISFELLPVDEELKKLHVALTLHKQGEKWAVILKVYDNANAEERFAVEN